MNRICMLFLLFSCPLFLWAQLPGADSLMRELEQHNTPDTVRVNLLIQYATSIGNSNQAIAFEKVTEAYTLAGKLDYPEGRGRSAVMLSAFKVFFRLKFDEAMRYALEALRIGERIHDKNIQSKAYMYMAACYQNSNDSLVSMYMQKALALAEEGGDEAYITLALMNSAIVQIGQKNYGAAIKLLERAYALAKKLDNEANLMGTLANMGKAYQGMNNNEAALQHYKEGIVYAGKQKNYRYWAMQLLSIGQIYRASHEDDKAFAYMQQALQISEENNLKENLIDVYGALRDMYKDLGKYKEAFTYQSKYQVLADSSNNLQSVQNMERMQEEFKLEREKFHEEQEAKAEADRASDQIMAIGLGIVGLSILVLLLSGSLVVRPRLVKLLSVLGLLVAFEFLNLLLHPFLERITHHSPMLMLASMAAIAGLLLPMHHRVEKLVTNKLVEKNKKIHLDAARKVVANADAEARDEKMFE